MPALPSDADPFQIETMRANQILMPVRRSFRDDPLPTSFYTGKAVGRLLHALSILADVDSYEAAVYGFLADWKFEGRWSDWQANASFRSGSEQAYRKKQSEREIPLTFKEIIERAAEIVDEGATLDRNTNKDQAAADVPGYTFNPNKLAESAIAIKEEYNSLDNNTYQII
jgi:hypothetical protein